MNKVKIYSVSESALEDPNLFVQAGWSVMTAPDRTLIYFADFFLEPDSPIISILAQCYSMKEWRESYINHMHLEKYYEEIGLVFNEDNTLNVEKSMGALRHWFVEYEHGDMDDQIKLMPADMFWINPIIPAEWIDSQFPEASKIIKDALSKGIIKERLIYAQ